MNIDWGLAQGADRVVYIAPEREFSKRLASLLEQVSPDYSAALDILSFVQPAKDQEDFEWRIVGNRSGDRVLFSVTDIALIYVESPEEQRLIEDVLSKKAAREGLEGSLPKVRLTKSLVVAA